jgi:hypothetical protein
MKANAQSLLQASLVFFGATVSSVLYVTLRVTGNIEIDNIDKFWCALPIFASLTVTNRCIVGRLIRIFLRRRK